MKYFIIILFFVYVIVANGQEKNRKLFTDGEYFFENEYYDSSAYFFQKLLIKDPTNYHCAYKLGLCYTLMPSVIWKAIPNLEIAKNGVTKNYDFSLYIERGAPFETYYFLGYAYQMTLQFDKAIENYEIYADLVKDTIKQISNVYNRISACKRADSIYSNPVPIEITNVGKNINTVGMEFNPCVSGNDSVMYFTREFFIADEYGIIDKEYHIFKSIKTKINGKEAWGKAENITRELGTEGQCYTIGTSYDGNTLILFEDYDIYSNNLLLDEGAIYISHYKKRDWSDFELVSSKEQKWEWITHASLSKDESTIFFSTKALDGFGGLDIFRSTKNETGTWSKATNLGAVINTNGNENYPMIVNDSILFFSSTEHNTIGGYDIFKSVLLQNGSWSEPVNLSIPVNSPADNIFYCPVNGGKDAYLATERPNIYNSLGKKDIFKISFITVDSIENSNVETNDILASLSIDSIPESGGAVYSMNESDKFNYEVDDSIVLYRKDSLITKVAIVERVKSTDSNKDEISDNITASNSNNNSKSRTNTGSDTILYSDISSDSNPYSNKDFETISIDKSIAYSNVKSSSQNDPNKNQLNNKIEDNLNTSKDKVVNNKDKINSKDIPVSKNENVIKNGYVIQIFASETQKDMLTKFPNLTTSEYSCSDGLYRYITGNYSSFIDAFKDLSRIRDLGYSDAFVRNIKYYKRKELKSVSESKYTIQLLATYKRINSTTYFPLLSNIKEYKDKDGLYRYYYGSYSSWFSAKKEINKVQDLGYDGFIQNLEKFQK